jgi:hypothetical protein
MSKDRTASAKALLALLTTLTDDELLAATDNPGKVKEYLGTLVSEDITNTHVVPLSDNELGKQFPQFAGALAQWRKLAVAMDYRGPVAWKVKAGFTLKQHAPLAGPCYQKLDYLQGWELKNDEPTKDSLVFWVPRLAEKSTGKTVEEMEAYRTELRQKNNLPENHCTSFGSIALQFALILAHFKRTGQRVPLECYYAASDTLRAGGGRLVDGDFDERALVCDDWSDLASALVGFFLLGVEELGL